MEKTVIRSKENSLLPDFRELYRYKHLIYSLAWRDIRVKYAQTYIGLAWAFLNPVINIIILSFVFGKVAKVDTEGLPHILFTVTGLAAWTYFATLLNDAGNSIIASQAMIKKIYFPRLVIPLSKALSGLVDVVVAIICIVVIMLYYGYSPGPNFLWLPLFLLISLLSGLAGGILVSALSVRYRDFAYVVPMLVRIGMFATPIAYSASMVPDQYKTLFYLNPMVGVVEGFRWSLLGTGSIDNFAIFSILIMIALLFISLILFKRVEHQMADLL